MNSLYEKYRSLKTRIGGNREQFGYEETFGKPTEESQHITTPARYLVRIISETEFAIRLSESLNGKYDDIINSELDFLSSAMEEEGCLTKSVCAKAEEMLMVMSKDAKEYKLILAGHAHIDMNWMWSWPETVASTVATFTTMLNIMDEYPQFCFSQSQTSVYKIIDDYAPELHDRIKQRIDEGRWEVTSSAWVETDKNMPNTESLLRHIGYSKKYLKEKWGIDEDKLEIDFSPDTFGHSANIPEIDSYGGVKYYYHCRALNGDQALYRWKGQSGKELLCYREQFWYNSAITPKPVMGLIDACRRSGGLKTGIAVYGVGDHGGGPTRRDVERGMEMQEWPVFPTIKFGTFREFFKEAESVRDNLPVVDHELNFIFTGCYTTQSRIKLGNRRTEAALSEAETVNTLANIYAGAPLHNDAFESAWQKVLFTHFHDILTGSCVQDTREHAMGLFQDALATANTETTLGLSKLSSEIDTSGIKTEIDKASQAEGAGAGYHISEFAGRAADERGSGLTRLWNVFNNTPADKKEPVEITVWDWTGDMRSISVTDSQGNPVEFQMIDGGLQHYWDHKYFRFLAYVTIPKFSYKTIVLTQGELGDYPVYFQGQIRADGSDSNYVLENDNIRAEFDYTTGQMISLFNKVDGKELLSAPASPVLIDTQRRNSDAWHIGSWLSKYPLKDATNIHWTSGGSLRKSFEYEAKFRQSKVTVEYSLDKNATAVKARIKADWSESAGEKVPVLVYEVPTACKCNEFRYNIPAGSIVREAAEADRPGLSYIAVNTEDAFQPAIVSDCKYGFRGYTTEDNAVMVTTLLNSPSYPDPYPERGVHDITLSIGILPKDAVKAELASLSMNRPLTPFSATSHTGKLPADYSLISVDSDVAVVSAVFGDKGRSSVRVYSDSASDGPVTIDFMRPVDLADLVLLNGDKICDARTDGTKVSFILKANTICTVSVSFK